MTQMYQLQLSSETRRVQKVQSKYLEIKLTNFYYYAVINSGK